MMRAQARGLEQSSTGPARDDQRQDGEEAGPYAGALSPGGM